MMVGNLQSFQDLGLVVANESWSGTKTGQLSEKMLSRV
jgi:hypothetical protein